VLTCKRLVFAIAPHLMKNITLEPSLHKRSDLERALVPGRAIKVVLAYQSAFWLAPPSSSTEPNQRPGPVHNWFHSSVGAYPALVGLITGPFALQCEALTAEQRRSVVIAQVRAMPGAPFEPMHYFERVWSAEEFSGGCFAGLFPPNGSFTRLGPFLRPSTGRIHWASTETAVEFYGYMEGALRSGLRAASEVAQAMQSS
jgi:monoamine oxidase